MATKIWQKIKKESNERSLKRRGNTKEGSTENEETVEITGPNERR